MTNKTNNQLNITVMKKVLLALCAVMMLSMTACNKDTDDPTTPSGGSGTGGTEEPETIPTGEGIFNPAQKIATITVDGELSEEWNWVDSVLSTILSPGDGGSMVETSRFEYNNYRVVLMTSTLEGAPFDATYTYSGDKLASVMVSSGTLQVLSIDFTHNASDKISHLTINVNSTFLAMLSAFLGDGIPDIFGQLQKTTNTSKMSLTDVAVSADLTWQGDNVSQVLFNAQIDGSVSLSEINQMVNLDSVAGPYAAMLSLLADTTAIPLTIVLSDTVSYTYDSYNNPYCGFLGTLDPASLSANNAVTMVNNGTATPTVTLDFDYMTIPLSFPYPIESSSQNYTYTYTAAGFPETVTDNEGTVTRYTYVQ